jgi:hypothetical protein
MQFPIRTTVLGLLLAGNAVAVHAQSKSPEATLPAGPAPTQQPAPINLSLLPASASQPAAIDLSLPPAAAAPAAAPAMAAQKAVGQPVAPQVGAGQAATVPAATAPTGPIDDLTLQSASEEVKRVASWVVASGDNLRLPYLLIDKVNAKVFAFTPTGQLKGAAPVLLGMAKGDRLIAPNTATMAQMPPQVRITPAGRFVSRLAIDSHGKELLVLDYDASISLHPVVKGTPKEHRAERLASATSQDNRISFGCINVPVPFYSTIVSPTFTGTKGVVYVLPETGPASALFGMPPVGAVVTGAQPAPAIGSPAAQAASAPGGK